MNLSKTSLKKEAGLQNYKKYVSNLQLSIIKRKISLYNNQCFVKGIERVISISSQRCGQADLYTWELHVKDKSLDIQSKLQRLEDRDNWESNGKTSLLTKDTQVTFDRVISNTQQIKLF
jgi:beta-lactamase class D